MLKINKSFKNGIAVIALDGKVDTTTASQFAKELPLGDSSLRELIVDCEKLEYISSAGLRVLLAAINTMESKGSLKLLHVSDSVMEVLDMTGLVDELTIEN